jgi:hypothetical protein
MRVLRDVVVDRTAGDELMAVSHAPGVVGEAMTLDLIGDGSSLALKVGVLESRPVIIAGAVRHRLRLRLLTPPAVRPTIAADDTAAPPSACTSGMAAEAS